MRLFSGREATRLCYGTDTEVSISHSEIVMQILPPLFSNENLQHLRTGRVYDLCQDKKSTTKVSYLGSENGFKFKISGGENLELKKEFIFRYQAYNKFCKSSRFCSSLRVTKYEKLPILCDITGGLRWIFVNYY